MSNNAESPRLSPDDRRDQILAVAAEHFARDGKGSVSVRDIAQDAGVTRALVYHYFPGKETLLEAVIRREAAALLDATAPDPTLSAMENLERALGLYLDYFSASGGHVRQLYAPSSTSPPLLWEVTEANHQVQVERIRTYLDQPDTPAVRLAIRAWLAFVTDAARERAKTSAVSRAEVISLCMNALSAVTGRRLGDASADFANIGAE